MLDSHPLKLANRKTRRRGVTLIVVLTLISVTLALSYGILRTQMATVQVQANGARGDLARQAAMSGLAYGLQKMSSTSWGGVGVTLTGSLSSSQSFTVAYQTGDASLSAADPAWPYRVTLLATGLAVDPAHAGVSTTHQVQAVVALTPRQLTAEPSSWAAMLQSTVYQFGQHDFKVQLPCQVDGAVRLQGTLRLSESYPPSGSGLTRYLNDLRTMIGAGNGDYRPLTGPVNLPFSKTSSSTRSLLTSQLGVAANDTALTSASSWSFPGTIVTYQLYPGGQAYTAGVAASQLTSLTLSADPRTNPAGIFVCNGPVTIGDNVTINGTLVCANDVLIRGRNVVLQAASLPPLDGTTTNVQLPTAIVSGNFKIDSGAIVTVRGLVAAWNDFSVLAGTQWTWLDFQGRIITNGTEWVMTGGQWNTSLTQFTNQSAAKYYPLWMQSWLLLAAPLLNVAAESTPVLYHYIDGSSPIYIADPADGGLRWSLLNWVDAP